MEWVRCSERLPGSGFDVRVTVERDSVRSVLPRHVWWDGRWLYSNNSLPVDSVLRVIAWTVAWGFWPKPYDGEA